MHNVSSCAWQYHFYGILTQEHQKELVAQDVCTQVRVLVCWRHWHLNMKTFPEWKHFDTVICFLLFFFLLFLVLTKTLSEQYCIFASSFWVFPHKLEDSLYKLNTKPNGIYNEQKITVIGDILQLQQVKNFSEYMSIILACGCLMTVVVFANFLFSISSNHYVAYL